MAAPDAKLTFLERRLDEVVRLLTIVIENQQKIDQRMKTTNRGLRKDRLERKAKDREAKDREAKAQP